MNNRGGIVSEGNKTNKVHISTQPFEKGLKIHEDKKDIVSYGKLLP